MVEHCFYSCCQDPRALLCKVLNRLKYLPTNLECYVKETRLKMFTLPYLNVFSRKDFETSGKRQKAEKLNLKRAKNNKKAIVLF